MQGKMPTKTIFFLALVTWASLMATGYFQTRIRPFESIGIDSVIRFDSLSGNPSMSSSDSKLRLFVKTNGSGGVGIYRLYRNGVTRVDSVGSGGGSGKRIGVFAWYNWAIIDSQRIFVADTTATIDSIFVDRNGGTSAVVNLYRKRSGANADLLTANYTTTTSIASAGTLQNNSLQNRDEIWATIRNISGTALHVYFQVNYH